MLLTPVVHAALVAGGLLGTVALGLACRRERAWAAPLLWLVPAAVVLSAADGALLLLSLRWPAAAWDGGDGDVLRLLVAIGVLLPPIEVLYQRSATAIASRGVEYRPASPDPR